MNALANLEKALGTMEKKEVKTVPSTKEERFKIINELSKSLNKEFETTGSIVTLGKQVGLAIPSICTSIPSLDYGVIGCGGIPRGRIIEVFGPESSGKTTITLEIIAAEQRSTDNLCAFIDAEHALDPTYAAKLGVNVNELLISQPDSGEQALQTAAALIESGAVSLVVIDSVSALVPRAELEGDMGDAHIGLQARLMSQAMRKLRGIVSQKGATVIFINQIREKVGVMFGSPETTSGGRALKFFASLRLDVRKRKPIKLSETEIVGHEMEVKAVKNKVGVPMKLTTLNLIYGVGVDKWTDYIEYMTGQGIITKSEKGGYYSFNGDSVAQGLTNAIEAVKLSPELKKRIDKALEDKRKADEKPSS
jgi:recombination protein RecA